MATELNINGMIVPVTSTDPTHEDIYGKGGYVCVDVYDSAGDDETALVDIETTRQKTGMLGYVASTESIYRWDGSAWSTTISSNILTTSNSVEDLVDITSKGSGSIITATERSTYDALSDTVSDLPNVYNTIESFESFTDTAVTGDIVIAVYATEADLTASELTSELVKESTISYVIGVNKFYKLSEFADTITISSAYNTTLDGAYAVDGDYWDYYDGTDTYRIELDDAEEYYTITDTTDSTTILYRCSNTTDNGYPPSVGWEYPDDDSEYVTDDDITLSYTATWGEYYILSAYDTTVPASSTATGVQGEYAYDSSYKYECTATDTWVRIALESTF